MKANELLYWLSARCEGSWRQFRAAVEELYSEGNELDSENVAAESVAFPLHQKIRLDYERLAHVEFFARDCEDGWRVTPPTLSAHSMPSGIRVILCGARSSALRERVFRATENLGYESLSPPGVPDVVRFVVSDTETLVDVATEVGLHFQCDTPLAILTYLPPCDPPSRRHKLSEFPLGADWRIHEFDVLELAWRKIKRCDAQAARVGLFRFLIDYQRPRYFLRWVGGTFELPRAVALYVLLKRKRRNLLRYDATTRAFSLPAICRPPQLLERALVLCSGLPPAFDPTSARLTYSDVTQDIALLAAELLRQPLS